MKRERLWAGLFLGPAVFLIAGYLVYPAFVTIYLSFFDRNSTEFVGLDNYVRIFTNNAMLTALKNNLLWLVTFPVLTVGLGLLLAVLTDRVRYESVAKSIIFLPMAISFAGAGVIWRFMYTYRPVRDPQISLLNQIRAALGAEPVACSSSGPGITLPSSPWAFGCGPAFAWWSSRRRTKAFPVSSSRRPGWTVRPNGRCSATSACPSSCRPWAWS